MQKLLVSRCQLKNGKACYVPLNHISKDYDQIDQGICRNNKKILEDESIFLKIGQILSLIIILKNLGINKNMDDTMLMSYVLRSGLKRA